MKRMTKEFLNGNLDMLSQLEKRVSAQMETEELETLLVDSATALAEIKKLLTSCGLPLIEVFKGIEKAIESEATTKAIEWKRANKNRLVKRALAYRQGTPTGRISKPNPEFQDLPRPKRTPSGFATYTKLNIGCGQQEKTAGFWRESAKIKEGERLPVGRHLPFPVKLKLETFHLDAFLTQLSKMERKAQTSHFKGWSTHRWDGSRNGSSEFKLKGWRWPAGYRTYIEGGLLPSASFFKFIMGYELAGLQAF